MAIGADEGTDDSPGSSLLHIAGSQLACYFLAGPGFPGLFYSASADENLRFQIQTMPARDVWRDLKTPSSFASRSERTVSRICEDAPGKDCPGRIAPDSTKFCGKFRSWVILDV